MLYILNQQLLSVMADLLSIESDQIKPPSERELKLYLREATNKGIVFTAPVLRVQAVVEQVDVADAHALQADVQLHSDAAPQVMAAAGELDEITGQRVYGTSL